MTAVDCRRCGDDVEGTAGTEFDHGSDGPIAEELANEPVAAKFTRLVDAAEYEALTLIESGCGAVGIWIVAILWGESGLKVGGIIDSVRPTYKKPGTDSDY